MNESDTPQRQDSTTIKQNQAENDAPLRGGSMSNDKSTEDDTRTSNAAERDAKWWRNLDWHLIIQMLLFIVGIRVACIYAGQLQQMIEQNKLTRQALCVNWKQANISQVANSAWVMVQDVKELKSELRPKHKRFVEWRGILTNGGPTPARDVVHKYAISTIDKRELVPADLPTKAVWDNAGEGGSHALILGGKDLSLQKVRMEIGPKHAAEIDSGYSLYIFGRITYIDAFNLHHISYYCDRLENGNLHICNIGNTSDYDLPKPPPGCSEQ